MVIWLASASASSQRYRIIWFFFAFIFLNRILRAQRHVRTMRFCFVFCICIETCLVFLPLFTMTVYVFWYDVCFAETKKTKNKKKPKFCWTVFNQHMCAVRRSACVFMFHIRYSAHVFGVRYLECHSYCIKCISDLEIDLLSCLDSFKCLKSVNPIPILTNSIPS